MARTMNSRERAFAAFAFEKVDRPPIWQADSPVLVIYDVSFADLFAMEDIGAGLTIDSCEKTYSDVITVGNGAWLGWLNAFGCSLDMSNIRAPIDVCACIKDANTDIPKLDKSNIKDQIAANEICQKILMQVRIIKERVGDEKAVQFVTGGPFTLACIMVGTEEMMMLLAEEDKNIPHLFDFAATAAAEMCNQMLESGCDVIFTAEPNTSADLISQKMFEEVAAPSIKSFNAQLKNCKYHCIHICGQSTPRIDSLMDMGLSAMSVDAIVDIKTAMDKTVKRMSMMGNLSPTDVLLDSSPDEVYKQAMDLVLYAGLDRGYFMMPGCDLAPGTPIENIDAMYNATCDAAAKLYNL